MIFGPIRVPSIRLALHKSGRGARGLLALALLLGIALALNVVLWWMFVRPVTRISALADRISLGEIDAPDFVAGSRDEIGLLAQSVSRMRRSLVQAIKMLET